MHEHRCYLWQYADDLKSGSDDDFLKQLKAAQAESFVAESTQIKAWEEELRVMKNVASKLEDSVTAFEYVIPRMAKRIDVVFLTEGIVFAIEFKVGEKSFPADAIDQVADYSFDLKNFHKESHGRPIVPIVVCTNAKAPAWQSIEEKGDGVYEVLRTNSDNLLGTINQAISAIGPQPKMDYEEWLESDYAPTPTIVEAAQALYESHQVEEITTTSADKTDIKATTNYINEIISRSKSQGEKSICFVTGVPGAGKTMIGLNIAAQRREAKVEDKNEVAVFLSGNGPLIEVLQEALTRDQAARDKDACDLCDKKRSKDNCGNCAHFRTKSTIKSEVSAFVQGVHLFRDEMFKTDTPPAEHIAIFDEAQRAWSMRKMNKSAKTSWTKKDIPDRSEPECLIEYMDRHKDWATIVCLVGGGQEIHDGEAGIAEWFYALKNRFPQWNIYASPAICSGSYLTDDEYESIRESVKHVDDLHLKVDMRSFRNKNVAAFAEAVVENRPEDAAAYYKEVFDAYPIYITRDLSKAKDWARLQTKRPSDRYGIIADSHGERIRADGIIVPVQDFKAAKWFLDGRDDINSSYYMEIAASEFKIQGLEIDYAIVAWEADYRYRGDEFAYHRFRGGKWQNINDANQRKYLMNGYRVLLTRARQGFVIYVPTGSDYDPTRKPEWYDGTYEYLKQIGIREL